MKYFFLMILSLIFLNYQAQTEKPSRLRFLKPWNDSTNRHNHFELSFGQNLLFISNSQQSQILNKESLVIPTSSVLFFAEFRPQKMLRIPVFLNIATESKQYLVNGQLVNEKANPTVGTGLVFKLLDYKLDPKSKLELEAGVLGSLILDKKNNMRVAPILALRLKVCRGENFVMYIGGNYSLGVKVYGLMYGTGTVF
ncbi:MAG: hypothetical protein ACO1O6_02715 [Bacteroidota bacterium]